MASVDITISERAHWKNGLERLAIPILLGINGAALAGTLAMSKAAHADGVAPSSYGFWMTLGAGLALAGITASRSEVFISISTIRYSALSALLSLAVPQLILLIVAHKVGAGLASAVYAFPTITTWVIARLFGLEAHSAIRLFGVLVGAAGALTLLAPGSVPSAHVPWLALALLVPFMLGAGNVYRSIAWPEGASPLLLASGTALSASLFFLAVSLVTGQELAFWTAGSAVVLVVAQMILSTVQFLAFFMLQRIAKPVVFSLIGQVGLLFGLVLGAVFFGEHYSPITFIAVGLIVSGWALVSFGGLDRSRPA
ncbi:MAG: DMT family transporter [Pseudomonadota bacterium]